VEEALTRAADHGRRAAAEALLAARALLDALSLALHGSPSEERRILGLAGRALDDLSATLAGGPGAESVLDAVAGALDAEIARWEARSRDDADARAVLRAYLGLREILWELGVRPADGAPTDGAGADAARGGRSGPRRRVQRVPVQG
jgi:hypothetical protein